MPFDESIEVRNPGYIAVSDYDKPDPTFLRTVSAAFAQNNPLISNIARASDFVTAGASGEFDRDYNVFDDIKGYEDHIGSFYDVPNKATADAIKAGIDRERRDRADLDASGWTGTGLSTLASFLDPTIALPGGQLVRSGRVGYSALRSGLNVGLASAAGAAIQETMLRGSQELRTGEESASNIAGSFVLGGLIGGVGGKFFSDAEWGRVSKSIENDLKGQVDDPIGATDTIVSRMKSLGAASVEELKLDDLGIGGPKAAQIVAKATASARLNPGIETMFSPSKAVRETYAKLVDNPVYTRMQMEGKTLGADVENLVKVYERGAVADWLDNTKGLYREARKAGYAGTFSDFTRDVSFAGRRNDIDVNGNSFVSKAAQYARQKIFDPLLERAKSVGLLPEDVRTTTAASYVTRLWNRTRLIGEEDRFREIARQYFSEQIAKLPKGEGPDFVNDADLKDYIEGVVSSVFNNLVGRGEGDVPEWIVPTKRGPLKERTFNIPDDRIEDFLENDAEAILRKYARTMAADVELTQKFGRADLKDQFAEINRDYDELAKAATSPADRQKLDKTRQRDIANLSAFRDLVRGTYRAAEEGSNWSKITRAALTWNYIRLLGGQLLTSLTDASNIIGKHGMQATMREALPALVSGVKAAKISRADAKALGAVTDRVLNSRLASMADLTDPYAYGSRYERFLSNTGRLFTKATGLNYWNDTVRTIASVMTQNRILRNVDGWAKMDKHERAYMALVGIDEDMAQRIGEQVKKYGMEDAGIRGANTSEWDDDLARRAYAAALNKDVDRTILVKGVADTPLWTRTNWGKLIMQFKGFALASHQRVLLAGLQERPHRLAEQMVFSTALGMMISYVKLIERNDNEEANKLLQNPGLWVANGLDRSGVLSIPFEISNTAEKLGVPGIVTGAQALAGDEDRGGSASRYASRGVVGALLGPSIGIIEDLKTISDQLQAGDLKKSGVNAAIRQIPGTTLPFVRYPLHKWAKPAIYEGVE